jgi:ATP phosphoribosyltransferase
MITIALTKGRILKDTLPLLSAAGITPEEDIATSRKLVFATNRPDVQLLVLRGADVLTYIRYGAADMGVVGKDTLMEDGGSYLYELHDLGIARCRLMTATKKNEAATAYQSRIKVATKYVNIAQRYYAEQGVQADIIKLYGGMELAPIMGLADEIVDIVDTGKTLVANGLQEANFIADISSRLVANKASMKVKHAELKIISDAIAAAVNK